jgi:[acyl-carrier-protein] S-malonyltransferase
MIAFICPGQGSQSVGMGREIYDEYPVAGELLDRLNEAVDFALLEMMFSGPAEELTATENAQPALLAGSLAAAAVLASEGIEAELVAGHSLGEYSALAVAGVIGPEDAVRLVRVRGRLMAEAGAQSGGAMAAVIGLSDDKLETAVKGVDNALVTIANFNSDGQTVISGEREGVAAASRKASELGAKHVIPIQVSGAFHCELMKPAAEKLAAVLDQLDFADAGIPVVTNVDATAQTDADSLKESLVRQLTEPVLWKQSIAEMVAAGVDTFVEVGSGAMLSKMLKRSGVKTRVLSTGSAADVGEVIRELT